MEESQYKKESAAYKLYWNETQIGEYTGPGAPKQFKEFLNDIINWKFIDITLRKATPIEKLKKIRRVYLLMRLCRYNTP